MADQAKAKGITAGNYNEAIKHFTDAINIARTNHVLYSNRSGAYASLNQYSEALADANKTVELKPDWSNVYYRLGAAHHGLRQYEDAISAYKKGLEVDPNNQILKSGLADAQSAATSSSKSRGSNNNPFGDVFGPGMWAKLTADPATLAYMRQPDFVKMMRELQRNLYLKDQRVMKALSVLLNIKLQSECDDMGKFAKRYTRKGAIQLFMKKYDKAFETYEGLKYDPQNQEWLDGVGSCVQQINRASRGDFTPDELQERQAKAMQDPEIQGILTDPVMAPVLKDLQENPKAAQDHMKNPLVMNKIQKLISSGTVQMK